MQASELTIADAQKRQPWTVPYADAVILSVRDIPHILASHAALHAAKSVGKLAAVFEKLDHTGGLPSLEQRMEIAAMSADLVTIALRFANLYDFDLALALVERVEEKNGVSLLATPQE